MSFYSLEFSQFSWEKGGIKCQGERACVQQQPLPPLLLQACGSSRPAPILCALKSCSWGRAGRCLGEAPLPWLGSRSGAQAMPGGHCSCDHGRGHGWPPTLLLLDTRPDVLAAPQACLDPRAGPAVTGFLADPGCYHQP